MLNFVSNRLRTSNCSIHVMEAVIAFISDRNGNYYPPQIVTTYAPHTFTHMWYITIYLGSHTANSPLTHTPQIRNTFCRKCSHINLILTISHDDNFTAYSSPNYIVYVSVYLNVYYKPLVGKCKGENVYRDSEWQNGSSVLLRCSPHIIIVNCMR